MLQPFLCTPAGGFSALQVDFIHIFRRIREYGHLVWLYFGNPTRYRKKSFSILIPNFNNTVLYHSQQWGVIGQDAHFTFGARQYDHIRLIGKDHPVLGDNFAADRHFTSFPTQVYPLRASIFALAWTSSMLPTM